MGDFHAISGDTNNNGEMKNAGGQTKRAIHASGVLDFLLDRTALWVGGLRKVGINLQLSLRTADAFPVVGREATTGNASAVRRLLAASPY